MARRRGASALVAVLVVALLAGPAAARPREVGVVSPRHLVLLDDAVVDDAGGDVDMAVTAVLGDAAHEVVGLPGAWLAPWLRERLGVITWTRALPGFSLEDASPPLVDALARDARVRVVEADRPVRVAGVPTGLARAAVDRHGGFGVGSGRDDDVDVALIDTGVAEGLADLRVAGRWDCRRGCRTGGVDRDGHGTHVAGIVAARDDGAGPVGVAPGARLWSIKVLDGLGSSGRLTDLVNALDLVAAHADRIEVVNISLGAPGHSDVVDRAVRGVLDAGTTVVVAAGNAGTDASEQVPANSPGAITVSAVVDADGAPGGRGSDACGTDDRQPAWSNHGAVVDVAAPGGCITSLGLDGRPATMSGTSMAAPHVTGAVAQYVRLHHVARSSDRPAVVRAGVLRDWTTPQHGACGFAGGVSAEPLLQVVPCGSRTPVDRPPPDLDATAGRRPRRPVSRIATVTFDQGRQLLVLDRWLEMRLAVVGGGGARLTDAEVTWRLRDEAGRRVGEWTATTGQDGVAVARAAGLAAGCYTVRVTRVRVAGRRWDRATPANERCL